MFDGKPPGDLGDQVFHALHVVAVERVQAFFGGEVIAELLCFTGAENIEGPFGAFARPHCQVPANVDQCLCFGLITGFAALKGFE